MAKKIMFQGTSSHVGKSILTTALCRIFYKEGLRVAPFKAQNMALNSYVTLAGDEIGRAQVVQAEAAGVLPIVQMNPVLLKPTGNASSQVVLMGKPVGVYSAKEYHTKYSLTALDKVKESLEFLDQNYDVIVVEGAGSPAEVNLKANDIVNMRVAKLGKIPVFLVADIDRGGALASIVGTLELLEPEERDLVKGIVINKFRGDVRLLEPAITFLEEKTGKPVLGVIPSIEDLGIEEEDSVSLDDKCEDASKPIQIAVLQTPKISNFTDVDAFIHEPDVSVRFVKKGETIGQPDMIILPGSKNTTQDLAYLKEQGFDKEIQALAKADVPVAGICGGYQMMGARILDPHHTESDITEIEGLGLLPIETEMKETKATYQVSLKVKNFPFLDVNVSGEDLKGYEIHMGVSRPVKEIAPQFTVYREGEEGAVQDGYVNMDGKHIFGSYIHGIFDNDILRRAVINALRSKKGLPVLPVQFEMQKHKDAAYDRLASIVSEHLDMDKLRQIMNEGI